MFHSDTFLLAFPVSLGHQNQWEYYTGCTLY